MPDELNAGQLAVCVVRNVESLIEMAMVILLLTQHHHGAAEELR
jgi:hypothetical protein